MIRIFVGYDPVETIAYHVLCHSILRRTMSPVSLSPIGNGTMPPELWRRGRGEHDSTEFSNARFMVPRLCEYEGWAIFMDCDMLCMDDIAELWAQRDDSKALLVRKHGHQDVDPGQKKFLNNEQASYDRKNWSSLMLINCAHPHWRRIDANNDPGLDLHQFVGLKESDIGEIQGEWNTLLQPGHDFVESSLVHFTLGGPWHGWAHYIEAYDWRHELENLLAGDNPCARVGVYQAYQGDITLGGAYVITDEDYETQKRAESALEAPPRIRATAQ
jgi:hypothetical protein